jgi:hypothetical protein
LHNNVLSDFKGNNIFVADGSQIDYPKYIQTREEFYVDL